MQKIVYFTLIIIFSVNLLSQVKGKEVKEYNKDTVFIFESPRPLITYNDLKKSVSSAYGLDITLTEAGFGAGFFFNEFLTNKIVAFASLYVTGARNTDEFDEWDFINQRYQVYNKINRLFRFPLTFGLQYFMFQDKLSESLQPFIAAGIGPTFIISTPYTVDRVPNKEIVGWFSAFGDAELHTRLGGFVGLGAYIGSIANSILGVHIKYYYVPFGDKGLESVLGMPIDNFGGIFLSLSFGTTF